MVYYHVVSSDFYETALQIAINRYPQYTFTRALGWVENRPSVQPAFDLELVLYSPNAPVWDIVSIPAMEIVVVEKHVIISVNRPERYSFHKNNLEHRQDVMGRGEIKFIIDRPLP